MSLIKKNISVVSKQLGEADRGWFQQMSSTGTLDGENEYKALTSKWNKQTAIKKNIFETANSNFSHLSTNSTSYKIVVNFFCIIFITVWNPRNAAIVRKLVLTGNKIYSRLYYKCQNNVSLICSQGIVRHLNDSTRNVALHSMPLRAELHLIKPCVPPPLARFFS